MKNLKSIIATIIILFSISCSNSQNFKSVEVAAFKATLDKTINAQLIDVRTADEFNGGHIDKAKNIDWNGNDFDAQATSLDKTKSGTYPPTVVIAAVIVFILLF